MKKRILGLILLTFLSRVIYAQTPTWSDDVACVVYNNCTNCHNANGIAHFSLLSYQDAFNYRYLIQGNVVTKKMPPFPVDLNYQHYAHERVLSQNEIYLINDWVNGGAPEGDPANAPQMPTYPSGGVIPNPDLVAQAPVYTVNTTADLYRCFVVPSNLSVSKFMTSFEIIPGNRNIVHHVLVYQDTSNVPVQLDAADPAPGYLGFGGVGSSSAKLIGAWVPGSQPYSLPNGMGIKIDANAHIILQIHYPGGTFNKQDSTRIEMKFSTASNLRNVTLAAVLNHQTSLTNGPLSIPANTIKQFNAKYNVFGNYSIIGVAPHMHLLGKQIKSYAVTSVKDTIPFVKIDDWDFHWQGFYNFKKLLKIPYGTSLYAEAAYDNTINNPSNPNTPPKTVNVGEATTDEMMLVYFAFLPYQAGDENMIIDTASAKPVVCTPVGINKISDLISGVNVFPNPASQTAECRFSLSEPDQIALELYDMQGNLVQSFVCGQLGVGTYGYPLSLNKLPAASYLLRVYGRKAQALKTLVHEQ